MSRAALAAVALLTAASGAPVPPRTVPTAPPLAGLDPATGASVVLDPKDGPMHLVVFATWCRPCVEQIPKLFDLEDRFKPEGYRLFLIALPTRQSVDRLNRFLSEGPVPGRLLFDEHGTIAAALGATTVPAHLLIDRKGNVVARTSSPDPDFTTAVERLVRQEGRVAP